MFLSYYLLSGLLHLAIVSPFLWLAKPETKDKAWRFVVLFYLVYLLFSILGGGLSSVVFNSAQTWNWGGKGAVLLLSLLFLIKHKGLSAKETGFVLRWNQGSVLPVILLLVFGIGLRLLMYFVLQEPGWHIRWETIAFQGGLNAIAEEVVFRGILLAFLNKVFSYRENIAGFETGTAALLVALLFALSYGVVLHANMHLEINLIRLLLAFIAGWIAAMLRERSGSLVPAIVFMALWSLIGNHY